MQNDREKEAEKGPGRGRWERRKLGIEVLAIWEGGVGVGRRTAMEVRVREGEGLRKTKNEGVGI